MSKGRDDGWVRLGLAIALATLLMGGLHALGGHTGLDLLDEGFLWLGVEQTRAGGVPLRDFQAYEPGRYYWGAAGLALLGPGPVALRAATAAFGTLGLVFGLLCAARAFRNPLAWILAGLVLAAWMAPRHKLFDSGLAMMAVWFAVRLVESPTWRRHLAAGAFVGAAACFGRNHALYSGLAMLTLSLWSYWKAPEQRALPNFGALALGGLLGSLPLSGMLLLVPGFAARFGESLWFFLERGSNHPLPIAWPWAVVGSPDWNWVMGPAQLAVGLGFVLLVVVYTAGVATAVTVAPEERRRRALWIASSVVGLFYAHHALARSDAAHLAQCIHPMWLAWFSARRTFGWPVEVSVSAMGIALALSLLALPLTHPHVAAEFLGLTRVPSTVVTVAGDPIELEAVEAAEFEAVTRAVRSHVPEGASLLIVPVSPGLYPALGRTSPVWASYLLWVASASEQRRMLEGIERSGVDWALVQTAAPFGRVELRFEQSHPVVWAYLRDHFRVLEQAELPGSYRLLRRVPSGGAGAMGGDGSRGAPSSVSVQNPPGSS